jgi:hypothetical protein
LSEDVFKKLRGRVFVASGDVVFQLSAGAEIGNGQERPKPSRKSLLVRSAHLVERVRDAVAGRRPAVFVGGTSGPF